MSFSRIFSNPESKKQLKRMSKERKEKIKKHVPKPIQPVFMSYAGIEGSEVYDSFVEKRLIYKSATFKKPK